MNVCVCVAKTQTNVSNENIVPYFFRFIQFTAITFWLMVPDAIQPVQVYVFLQCTTHPAVVLITSKPKKVKRERSFKPADATTAQIFHITFGTHYVQMQH